MVEITINGVNYRAGKLNAFQQLHLSRKLAPILPKLLPVFTQIAGRGTDEIDIAAMGEALGPLAQSLAEMSDSDCEYVYGVCLSVISRQQGPLWASIWNAPSKSLMFEDIDLPVMTQLVITVIKDNLGPFMQGLLDKAALAAQASSPVIQQ